MSGLFKSFKKRADFFADPLGLLSDQGKKLAADPLGILGVGEGKPVASTLADEAPVVGPVKPMPLIDDSSIKAAKRKSVATQRRRRGRASTILSDKETLGG